MTTTQEVAVMLMFILLVGGGSTLFVYCGGPWWLGATYGLGIWGLIVIMLRDSR